MPGGAPGAALLHVSGVGVRDVIGEGGTRGWAHPISGEDPASFRALLIDADPSGALTFRIEVDDVSAPTPTVTVLEIADRANELRAVTADVRVHLTLR
jgi:hypothetical protein